VKCTFYSQTNLGKESPTFFSKLEPSNENKRMKNCGHCLTFFIRTLKYFHLNPMFELQWAPLNVITLDQDKSDNNKLMITKPKNF
jgi:hypothetical protein